MSPPHPVHKYVFFGQYGRQAPQISWLQRATCNHVSDTQTRVSGASQTHDDSTASRTFFEVELKISMFTEIELRFFFVFFCICLCKMFVWLLEPLFIPVSQDALPELALKDETCVYLCKPHTCLLTRACWCVYSNISTLPAQLIISHMSSNETGNDVVRTKRRVFWGSPQTDFLQWNPGLHLARNHQTPMNHRLHTLNMRERKNLGRNQFDLFFCWWDLFVYEIK